MTDTKTGPGWSSAQWDLVNKAVTEAFGKANVAGAFLPCYGPLADSAEYVRAEKVIGDDGRLQVDDDDTLKLFNVRVLVELSNEQVSEEGLSSALLAFRRAANILGHKEDELIFNGYDAKKSAAGATKSSAPSSQKPEATVTGPDESKGLAEVKNKPKAAPQKGGKKGAQPDIGELLVKDVVRAIGALEKEFHPGPFVGVLGDRLFEEAHRPRPNSMVLPADRIAPMLNGSLFRCGRVDDKTGIVVSLGGSDIDIVVATAPRAQFLQVTENAKYLFRVYEKFRLRIKDPTAVEFLRLPPF